MRLQTAGTSSFSMKPLFLVISMTLSLHSLAQDLNSAENKYLGYIYQQQEYKLDDPKGDILLLWTARQIPKFILGNLKGSTSQVQQERKENIDKLLEKYPEYQPKPEQKNLVVNGYQDFDPEDMAIQLEGHKAPFKVNNVVDMMKQVITEEYRMNDIEPKEGTPHEWSPEIKKEIRKKFPVYSRMSKLLVALSRGATSHYMVTGTEDQLADYILSRPENSINLEEMFRASYRINKGDMYLTLLSIENVLSRYWLSPDREHRAITTRLKDITNYNYKSDKFGAWYHLFGIMLYGYVEGGFKAKVIGNIETLGSKIMGRFKDEKQESYINSRGGPIGAKLKRFIKKGEYKELELNDKCLEEDYYMDLDEDFSKRLEKALKKQQKNAA